MNDPPSEKKPVEVRPSDKVAPDENVPVTPVSSSGSSSDGPSPLVFAAFVLIGLVAGALARYFGLAPTLSTEGEIAVLTVISLILLPLTVSIRSDFRRARQKRLFSTLRKAEPDFFQYVERIAPRKMSSRMRQSVSEICEWPS